MKRMLLAGTACVLMTAVSAPAFAQSAPAKSGDQAPAGDIVVTAQHVRALASKTPLAITAVSGDSLRNAGITSPTELRDVAPSLSIDHTGGLQITIRGVTSTDQTEKGDSSVGFYLDGVYIARTQEADISFFDVDRVEVLRGPQGTLYGRNTTGGVVNVLSKQPQLGVLSGDINAGYGNYNAFNVDAAINLPIGSDAALRVAASYDRRDNYIKLAPGDTSSLQPGREAYAERIQFKYQPSTAFTTLFRAEFSMLRGEADSITNNRFGNFYTLVNGVGSANSQAVWANNSVATELTRANAVATEPGIAGTSSTQAGERNPGYAFENQTDVNLGPVTLTNIAAYRHYELNETASFDVGAPIDFPGSDNNRYIQFSDEFRISTNGSGPFHLQAGAYLFHENGDIDLTLFGLLNPTPGAQGYVYGFPQNPVINRTYAGFAQGTYKFADDKVRLTAGMRYTHDYKYRYGHTVELTNLFAPLSTSTGYVNDALVVANKVTWKVGVDADVANGIAYANVSSGYKAGGFGDGCSTGAPGQSNVTSQGEVCNYAKGSVAALYYLPETLTAYEVGYKGRFADNHIRLNADAFYYDYKNLQLSEVIDVAGAPSTVTQNAGAATIKGLEVEAIVTPNRYNMLTIGFDELDARYKQYCPTTSTVTGACVNNWAGYRLDRSPATVVRAAYQLTIPTGDGHVDAKIGTRLTSKSFVTAFYTYPEQFVTPAHTTTDLSLTYHAPGDRFTLQAYAKNLENFITVNGVNTFGGVTAFGEPRTFGARAGFKF